MCDKANNYSSLVNILIGPTTITHKGDGPITVDLPRGKIFCSLTGHVSVLRAGDGLTIYDAEDNFIFAINRVLGIFISDFVIKVSGSYEYALLDVSEARSIIDNNNAWYQVSYLLSEMSHVYALRDSIQSQKSVYQIIKSHLESIWALEVEQRSKTSIYKYILSRTTISRSALHKIIYQLNYGGYITCQRGFLLNVDKLPNRY